VPPTAIIVMSLIGSFVETLANEPSKKITLSDDLSLFLSCNGAQIISK